MRLPALSFALVVAASWITSACSDDSTHVDETPDAAIARPDGDSADATSSEPDARREPDATAAPDATPDATPPPDPSSPDAGPSGLQLPSLGNNGGRVNVAFGSDQMDTQLLQKEVAIQAAPVDGFSVGPAFLTKSFAGSTYVYTFIHVQNLGNARRCFVSASDLLYLDAGGATVASESSAFVYGTIGVTSGGATGSCLAGGESGYIFTIREAPYDAIRTLAFSLDTGSKVNHEPGESVLPEDIALGSGAITMNARNLGPGTAFLGGSSSWLAFDTAARPVAFGFSYPCDANASVTLASGQALGICASTLYPGHGDVLQARIGFSDATAAKLSSSKEVRAEQAARARLKAAYLDSLRR
jgi:hypothetical protein